MEKFRIKLKNGRVLGPFIADQFAELYLKGHILGNEDCQVFPVGDWMPINAFPQLVTALKSNNNSQVKEATFIKKISDFQKIEIANENEEESSIEDFPEEFIISAEIEEDIIEDEVLNQKEIEISNDSDNFEATKLNLKKNSISSSDKTIVNIETKNYLKQLEIEKEKQRKLEEISIKEVVPDIDYENDSTQMINLKDVKSELQKEIKINEKNLSNEEKRERKKKLNKEKLDELENLQDLDEEDGDGLEFEKNKKKRLIYLISAFLFIYFLLPDPEKKIKPIEPVYSTITFPQRFDSPNVELNKKNYLQAMELYKQYQYLSLLESAKYFKIAVENDFKDVASTAKLIMVYSKLLDSNLDKINSSNKIFKLVQVNSTKAYKHPDLTAAIAFYYYKTGKINASIKTIEKFNVIKENKPSLELFGIYLKVLIENGDMIKAKAVYDKLISVDKRAFDVDITLIDYNFKESNYDEAIKLVNKLEEKYPKNVHVLLLKAKLYVYGNDFKSLDGVLRIIQKLEAEKSPIYFAKYLEYKGMLAVSNNDISAATKFFKHALSINESKDLRARLSLLVLGNNEEVNDLIKESKAIEQIEISKNHIKNKNWKFAFTAALEATRIAPNYVNAKLFLADLQVKLNYFQEALTSLEELYNTFPTNKDITFSLTNAYINSFKFKEANKLLATIATSDLRNDPYFSKLNANYYVMKDDFLNSVKWLQSAINNNPLDDELVFNLAKLFIKNYKFGNAKILLSKAFDLDPSNVDYRIAYSNIIYETDGVSAAVGYLYDLLIDFPDDPKIYSTIGINYYKSGQLKSFEQIKDKLQKLPKTDETLYRFLIQAAFLDDKTQDVIEYTNKLIRINPYDLNSRMKLGQIYIETENFSAAIKTFKEVEARVPTYPKLQYYMSKLYLLVDENEKAIEFAKNEINSNPLSELGYILLGDIFLKEEKYLEAEKEYKKAQKIAPKNVDTLIGLANINFKKNQYEIALDLFNKAIAIDSSRSELHKLLGDVYRKIGQSDLAVKSYKTFLELSPTTKYRDQLNNYIKMRE